MIINEYSSDKCYNTVSHKTLQDCFAKKGYGMKRYDSFTLTKLNGTTYILPIAQAQADSRKGISVNECGEFIWKLLSDEITLENVVKECISHFEANTPTEIEMVTTDVGAFVSQLEGLGMLACYSPVPNEALPLSFRADFGGTSCAFYGETGELSSLFKDFPLLSVSSADSGASIRFEFVFGLSGVNSPTVIILKNPEFVISEASQYYSILVPGIPEIKEIILSKDGLLARFVMSAACIGETAEKVFQVLRTVFLYNASLRGLFAIHSAGIAYEGKAWLFSAYSGTGKTTHVTLWNDLYGTPVINGDLNLIGFENGICTVFPTPWCGTSKVSVNKAYPLGGIFFLSRDTSDFVKEMSDDKKIINMWARCISPVWDSEKLDREKSVFEKIIPGILCAELHATMNPSAAGVAKEAADKYLG